MRAIKLSYLAIMTLLWWLTVSGYHTAPVDRHWFVFLLGTSVGYLLGCLESRHTYNYGSGETFATNSWWHFPKDCLWMLNCALVGSILVDFHLPGYGIWCGLAMGPTFLYFGWPRERVDNEQ